MAGPRRVVGQVPRRGTPGPGGAAHLLLLGNPRQDGAVAPVTITSEEARGRASESELESVQSDPQVRFGLFLDVDSIAAPRSSPPAPRPDVFRHKEGLWVSCWRNSSVAQICPGCTWGSTRAAQSTASPPAMITDPSLACRRVCSSP